MGEVDIGNIEIVLIFVSSFLVKRKKIIKVRPFWHYFLGIRPMLRAKYERVILLELSVE